MSGSKVSFHLKINLVILKPQEVLSMPFIHDYCINLILNGNLSDVFAHLKAVVFPNIDFKLCYLTLNYISIFVLRNKLATVYLMWNEYDDSLGYQFDFYTIVQMFKNPQNCTIIRM